MTQANSVSPRRRCRPLMGVRVSGTGGYVPDGVVTNEHLQQKFGCKPEWIVKQTGISERRHALPFQATSDLAYEAGLRCIEAAGVDPVDIDLLLLATTTPDMSFPATACLLQDRLHLKCPALDMQVACSGFMYALITGATYILSGASDRVLVIGAECSSRGIDPNDLKTYALFGDGAGAVLLERGSPDQGILSFTLGSDGSGHGLLTRPACGSRLPPTPELLAQGAQYLRMDGQSVFRWAVSILCDTVQDVLNDTGLRADEIDLYFPHQANIRIINAAFDVLHVDRERVYCNLDRFGNTSAASVPLALDEATAEGRLKPGQRVILSGFGAGLAWGTALMRW